MRTRWGRTVLVGAIATVALLSGCGGVTASNPEAATQRRAAQNKAITVRSQELAAQDRNIIQGERLVAQNRAELRAAIRARWQARAAIVRAEQQRQRQAARAERVVEVSAYSSINVCAQSKQARRQALYYLNLSCPSR